MYETLRSFIIFHTTKRVHNSIIVKSTGVYWFIRDITNAFSGSSKSATAITVCL